MRPLLVFLALAAASATAQPVALTDVSVVDVAAGAVVPGQTVVVADGRIAAVGSSASVAVPDGAAVVEGAGRFLIPGLWDMHVHMSNDRIARASLYPLLIAHGVTGIRNMKADCFDEGAGACGPVSSPIAAARARLRDVAAGALVGPRAVFGSAFADGAPYGEPSSVLGAATPEHARAFVRLAHARGVDFVKVYDGVPREAFVALADEAARLGLPIAGHVPVAVRASEASAAGLRSVEHCCAGSVLEECSAREAELRPRVVAELSSEAPEMLPLMLEMVESYDAQKCEALFARFVENGTWVTPTLLMERLPEEIGAGWREDPRMRFLPPEERAFFEAAAAAGEELMGDAESLVPYSLWIRRVLREMHAAGVRILAGSDAGAPGAFWGSGLHDELALLVATGLTPAEALRAATLGPAEFLGAADSLGTVEAGKLADLVLLDANPLEDIANTRRIRAVVAAGRYFDREALDGLLAGVEQAALPVAVPNDHRQPAGALVDGELRVALVATEAVWVPRGADGPRVLTPMFAEEGGPPLAPGPLLRPTVGTPVRVTVRNALRDTLHVRGLIDRAALDVDRPDGAAPEDADFFFDAPLVVPPGETAEARFTPTAEVTTFYYGRLAEPSGTPGAETPGRFGDQGLLMGALVVDGPEGLPPGERLFAITRWGGAEEPSTATTTFKFAINGLSWPHTERLEYAVGEDVRWRLLNLSAIPHPMHLHGFYFAVEGRGDTDRDSLYAEPALAVTDLMPDFSSLRVRWTPERPGNWLFHCHLIRHMGADQRFEAEGPPRPMTADAHSGPMAMDGMAGLVMGIHVEGEAPDDARPARTLHLWTAETTGVFGDDPALSFVVTGGSEPPADTLLAVGSPLVLREGEPTEIVVHNRLGSPLSVHWHGLEVRSLYDGVGHWSGSPGSTRPPVAPGGTQRVVIEPPRPGTFMYHVHGEPGHELAQGLHGAFLVLPEGEAWDRARDRVFVLSERGAERDAPPAINGEQAPGPERFARGEVVRLRFAHISADARKYVRLLRDGESVVWRPVAKDGADLPASAQVPGPAAATLGVGETLDVEWTPATEGVYVLKVETEHYSAALLPPALQRVAFGVGDVPDAALAAAARVEVVLIERDTSSVALGEAEMDRLVGTYVSAQAPVDLVVARDGGGLRLTVGDMAAGRLVPVSPTRFRFEDPIALRRNEPYPELTIEHGADGTVLRVMGAMFRRLPE